MRVRKPGADLPAGIAQFYDGDERKYHALLEIVDGGSREAAALAAGRNSRQTLKNWMDADPEFAAAVADADLYAKERALQKIKRHGSKDWRALEAWLKLRYPMEFAARAEMRHIGHDGGAIKAVASVDFSGMSDEQVNEFMAKLAERRRTIVEDLGGPPQDAAE